MAGLLQYMLFLASDRFSDVRCMEGEKLPLQATRSAAQDKY